jgi:class 3 adenylate cyclase
LLTEDDVKELGLPLGPRRRLLAALGILRSEAAPSPRDEAERRQLTVMFVDLADSTALATRLDPEAMREVLRGYQNTVAGEITRVGGHVAKLMGDGVLAYFGWPCAHEDDAERSARAGLAVVEAVSQLAGPEVEKLAARVGIATGLVVVGDLIGEGAAREHAVVGTTPNLVARLQAEAANSEVVIAEGTRRLLGRGFIVEAVGKRLLKGHDDPLPLFRVLREELHGRRFVGIRTASMVGRAAELAALCTAWQQARTGSGQAVLLTGEAGIGKSRLLHSLVDAIAEDDPSQFFQCSAIRSENPSWPICTRGHRARPGGRGFELLAERIPDRPQKVVAPPSPTTIASKPRDLWNRADRGGRTVIGCCRQKIASANPASRSTLCVIRDPVAGSDYYNRRFIERCRV